MKNIVINSLIILGTIIASVVVSTSINKSNFLGAGKIIQQLYSSQTTSTLSSNLIINKSATSTVQLGGTYGGCLVLGSGKTNNILYVFPTITTGGIYLATSTLAADCY